jgi:hypothetical protein
VAYGGREKVEKEASTSILVTAGDEQTNDIPSNDLIAAITGGVMALLLSPLICVTVIGAVKYYRDRKVREQGNMNITIH